MINRDEIEEKMKNRGFTVYSTSGLNIIHFISAQMYGIKPNRRAEPIINIEVNLNTGNFQGKYIINNSINILQTPECGSVMNDIHFDKTIRKLESQAKILERFYH